MRTSTVIQYEADPGDRLEVCVRKLVKKCLEEDLAFELIHNDRRYVINEARLVHLVMDNPGGKT